MSIKILLDWVFMILKVCVQERLINLYQEKLACMQVNTTSLPVSLPLTCCYCWCHCWLHENHCHLYCQPIACTQPHPSSLSKPDVCSKSQDNNLRNVHVILNLQYIPNMQVRIFPRIWAEDDDDPSLVVAAAARVGPGAAGGGVQLLLLQLQIH